MAKDVKLNEIRNFTLQLLQSTKERNYAYQNAQNGANIRNKYFISFQREKKVNFQKVPSKNRYILNRNEERTD